MSTNQSQDKQIFDKPVFNSKLFIDLDINEEIDELNESSENNTEGSENSFELEETNYLSNELIEELDFCNNQKSLKEEKDNTINNINDNHNIIDSLLSLANNGYEFKPKNYNPSNSKNINKNIYSINNYINPIVYNNNKYLFNHNNIRDQKKDWICSFCNNLNYSFRTKCNRCKVKKEDSDKRKNITINPVI
jgi:hypothetical protein